MIPCGLPGLLTVGYRLYGDESQLSDNAIQHLYELYVKMNKQAENNPSLMQSAQQACLQLEQGYYPYHLMYHWAKMVIRHFCVWSCLLLVILCQPISFSYSLQGTDQPINLPFSGITTKMHQPIRILYWCSGAWRGSSLDQPTRIRLSSISIFGSFQWMWE